MKLAFNRSTSHSQCSYAHHRQTLSSSPGADGNFQLQSSQMTRVRGDRRGRGDFSGSRGRGGHNSRVQLKGLLKDGIWHCNCSPRLPAEHFKVKKEGKNQGRWFYTCQQVEPLRCGFFLWDEDAKVRSEATVIGGKRTEPGVQEGWNAGRDRIVQEEVQQHIPPGQGLFSRNEQPRIKSEDTSTASPSPPPSHRTTTYVANGNKRSAPDAALDRADFGSWAISREEEASLAAIADATAPITPHKAQKTGVYATPATTNRRKLPWLEHPREEALHHIAETDYFNTPSKAPAIGSEIQTDPHTPAAAAPQVAVANTPTPLARHRNALDDPADDESSLTSEVLSTLSAIKMPTETMKNLRGILTKHDLRTQGVKRGRDISRLALKVKDAKIIELQARISSLEADQEVERSLARMKKWENGQHGNRKG